MPGVDGSGEVGECGAVVLWCCGAVGECGSCGVRSSLLEIRDCEARRVSFKMRQISAVCLEVSHQATIHARMTRASAVGRKDAVCRRGCGYCGGVGKCGRCGLRNSVFECGWHEPRGVSLDMI